MSKTISAGALTLLNSKRRYYQADLFEFTLVGGTVLRYTSGDADITYLSNVYAAGGRVGPFFQKSDTKGALSAKLGLDVDTYEFDVIPGASTVLGIAFNAAAQAGVFDGAKFTIYRCVMATYGDTSLGATKMLVGIVGKVKPGSKIHFTCNSLTVLLNTQLPRNLYSPTCINVLGDTACAVNLATYTVNGTVGAGTTVTSVVATMASAKAAGFYELGRLILTSGPYSGQSRSIKKQTGVTTAVTLSVTQAFPAILANGTTFQAIAGCNKILTDSNGCPKFANQLNFRGHPYVPIPETAA